MAVLTSDQLSDIRTDVGDSNGVFSDAELQRLWIRTGEHYEKTVLLALDALIADSVKLTDYKQNMSDEKASQVFDHLLKLRSVWNSRVAESVQAARKQFVQLPIVPVERRKTKPEA